MQIINTNRLSCLLFALPPLSEHSGDPSDRCGARWHRSDPRALSLGSRGSSRGFTRTSAVAVSPVRKLMLAGDQAWWKLSPTSSAPPPHPVPPVALGEERVREAAAWPRRGFPAARPARTKKVSDPVRAGVRWRPRARQSKEIYASTSMAHTSDLQSWEPAWWEGRGAETHSQVLICARDAVLVFIWAVVQVC